MSVDETNKIDSVAVAKDNSSVTLAISDHLDWEEEGEHLLLLQEKLNTYLYFAESGKLLENFPEIHGLPVKILIFGKFPLSGEATRFFGLAKEMLAKHDLSLEFKLFKGMDEPSSS